MSATMTCYLLLALCMHYQLGSGARGEEGCNEGLQQAADVLLLYSGSQEAAKWFNASDTLRAACLANAALGDSQFTVELVEESCLGDYLARNRSVIAVVSAECTNDTCQAHSPPHGMFRGYSIYGLPVISYSPSCLGGDDSDTSTSVGSAKVPTSRPFCMLPSLDHLPAGIAALVSHFKWQRAAVISEEGGRLAASAEDIYSELRRAGVGEVRLSSLASADNLPSDILHRDYRIVVLNLTPSLSRRVLCEAAHKNLSQYVWITPGWYPHSWWLGISPTSHAQLFCSDEEMESFLGRGNVLSVLQSPLQPPDNTSTSFERKCALHGIADCTYAGLAYDAVCTVATALMTDDPASDLHRAISESDFPGVSGRVQFDSDGYRVWGSYKVGQMRYVERLKNVPVATLIEDPNSGRGESEGGMLQFIYTHNESEASVWPDGVPQDGSPLEELKHPLFTLVVICYMLSGAVILWAMVCIVFNICFRNKKLIKLTSPTLNYVIAVGIILMNLGTPMTMYLSSIESALGIFCIVRVWVFPIGWSLSLSTISVKMWRVFIIYRSTKKLQTLKHKRMRRYLRDWHMIAIILSLVVVDVVILIIGTSLPSTRFRPQQVQDKEFPSHRNSEDIEVVYHNRQCVTDQGLMWVAALFGYKLVLQISGMVLAFLTRKVKVRGLNESLEVQLVMFITTPIIVLALLLRFIFPDYLNVVGMVYALGTALVGGVTLGIIFLPKMVALSRNPSGDHIYLSKYISQQTTSENTLSIRGRSLTNTSLLSFDRTSSLKSLFRRASTENGLAVSSQTDLIRKKEHTVEVGRRIKSRNVLFTLPKIEEATCSNDATTSESVVEVNPLLLQGNGDVKNKDSEPSKGFEDSISSTKFLLSTCNDDVETNEERDSDSSSSTGMKHCGFAEETIIMQSPTEPILFSQLNENASPRDSWLVLTNSTTDTAAGSSGLFQSTTDPAVGSSGLFQSTTDPAMGPSGLFQSTTDSTTNSSGLFQSTTGSTAGHSGLFQSTTDPAAVQSTTDPATGSSGLFQSTTDSAADSSGLFQPTTDPAADSSGLFQLTTDPAAGSSGLFQSTTDSAAGSPGDSSGLCWSITDSSGPSHNREEAAAACDDGNAMLSPTASEINSMVGEKKEENGSEGQETESNSEEELELTDSNSTSSQNHSTTDLEHPILQSTEVKSSRTAESGSVTPEPLLLNT